jgi:spore maturation protein CgeB
MSGAAARTAFLVGDFASNVGALEGSFARAFVGLGWRVVEFDLPAAVDGTVRFGPVGRVFHRYAPVESWIRRGNRALVVEATRVEPDVIFVFGKAQVQVGTLAQLAVAVPGKRVLVWPDTLVNLQDHVARGLPLYDLVASYSSSALLPLRLLGARAEFIPLGADPELHPARPAGESVDPALACDVSFVGNWRPEREEALAALCECGEWSVKIWGGKAWGKPGVRRSVRRAWQGGVALAGEFARVCRASKIALNVIDPTNHPAANMRVFEIPATGALELCSPCPEMERELRDGEHLFYFATTRDLPHVVPRLLSDPALRERVAAEGQRTVLREHTYTRRIQRIVSLLGEEFPGAAAT